MPLIFLDHYCCAICDCRISYEYGEWCCECWAVGDATVDAGIEDLPPSWVDTEKE